MINNKIIHSYSAKTVVFFINFTTFTYFQVLYQVQIQIKQRSALLEEEGEMINLLEILQILHSLLIFLLNMSTFFLDF